MQNLFYQIKAEEFNECPFRIIGKDWMLVCAGSENDYNMMTASWGGFGVIWNKPVAFIFIRPQRYTYRFLERSNFFSLNFFDNNYRQILNQMGTVSGREVNKMKINGLTPYSLSGESVGFSQSKYIIECRKLYFSDLNPVNFLEPSINNNYPEHDYHRMYFGEVVSILKCK